MSKLIVFMLFISQSFASGNYQQSRPSPSAASTSVGPQPREAKSIESDILSWNRGGVSVHGVSVAGNKFTVKGAFTRRQDFQRFLSKLKGEDGGATREVTVKESSVSFAGEKSYTFEAEAENAW